MQLRSLLSSARSSDRLCVLSPCRLRPARPWTPRLEVMETTRPEGWVGGGGLGGAQINAKKGFTRALLKAAEGDAKIRPQWSRRELFVFIEHLYLKICVSCNLPQTCLTSLIMHIFNIHMVLLHVLCLMAPFFHDTISKLIFLFLGPSES